MTAPANTVTLTLYETGNRPEQARMLRAIADLLDRHHQEAQQTVPAAADEAERLPWSYWAPELRQRLKQLAQRFPAQAIADCAAELAKLIDEHGPKAEEHLEAIERDEARRR